MGESNICLSKIKNKNKKNHCLTKKHKYFSNLIINKFTPRNPEINKIKDIIQPLYDKQKKLMTLLFALCGRKMMCL